MKHVKALSALALAFALLAFLSAAASAQTAITVSGRLTNGLGEPLPGQQIGIAGPAFGTATTDANGRYAISVPAGTYELSIGQHITETEHYNTSTHVPPYYSLQTSSFDILQNTTLNLQIPFRKLSVHVQDSQGTPVANVLTGADGSSSSNVAIGSLPTGTLLARGPSFYSYIDRITTNANGDVDLWLLPTPTDPSACGTWGCGYFVTAQPPAGGQLGTTTLSGVTPTQDSSVTITLQPSTLSGRVTDAQGNPLADLALALRGSANVTAATTDVSGRYSFSVPVDSYSLIVANSPSGNCPSNGIGSYGPWCFRLDGVLTLTPNMTLDLLLPFKRVTVHIVDANGQPIDGADLGTNDPASEPFTLGGKSFTGSSSYFYDLNAGRGIKTDANGNATLLLLPVTGESGSGSYYSITVYPPAATGLPAKTLSPIFVFSDTSLTISYVTSVTLSGRVTDAQGNGLPNQTVELGGADIYSTLTDSSGYYSFSMPPASRQMYIRGGVPVSSGLHAPQSVNLASAPFPITENMTLDLSLPFQRVNVHVVDVNDQPINGAGLNADVRSVNELNFGGVSFFGSSWGCSSYLNDPHASDKLSTDANGNATLWLLPVTEAERPQGGYWMTAYPPAETRMSPVYSRPIFVSGETNVTMRSNEVLPPPQPKAPVIASISPSSAEMNSPDLTLIIDGTDFVANSTVYWSGTALSTTFVSSTRLMAIVPSGLLIEARTAYVYVVNPADAGGESNSVPFTINYPPSVTFSGRITDAAAMAWRTRVSTSAV